MPRTNTDLKYDQLLKENQELRNRLQETEDTLNAIRNGEVDAIIITGEKGDKVFSIASSETPYRIIIEEMDEGAATVSFDGTILYCNHRFSEMMATPFEQIVGSDFARFIAEKDMEEYKYMLSKSHRQKMRGVLHGKKLILQLSFIPLPEEMEGDVCVVVTDITEIRKYQNSLEDLVKERSMELKIANQKLTDDLFNLKRAGIELKESERRFKQLANSIPQLAWISRSDGRRTWYNKRWYEFTGSNFREMKGFGWEKVHDPVRLQAVINRWNNSVAEGKTFEMVFPMLGKDGTYREFLTRGIPIRDSKGNILHWFGTNTDISELKKVEKELEKSQKKLRLALENGNIGTWEWNLKTNEIICDERMRKMMGFDHQDVNYQLFERHINEEDLAHFKEALTKTLKNHLPFETVFRTNKVNEEYKYISTKALLTRSRNGKPASLNGVCFDITSMKKGSEQVLIKLNEELLRSNRDLQQFAYVASHDLQEPLRMVSSFTQLLALRYHDKIDPDGQEFINYAVDGAKRMYDLLNGLLAYSRVQTKGREFSNIDMNLVFQKVIQNLALKIEEKNALITVNSMPVISADESQMIQLVQNLFENSLKFCTKKPVITVSCKLEDNFYIFSVKDNGLGIESRYFERIFQIFQRLHLKSEYDGTGIGLAICKRIVERHKGKIWLESKPEKGSTFYFSIQA